MSQGLAFSGANLQGRFVWGVGPGLTQSLPVLGVAHQMSSFLTRGCTSLILLLPGFENEEANGTEEKV